MMWVIKNRFVLMGLIVLIDRLSKYWVLNSYDLPSKGSVEILPFFNLTMVWNKGISLGLFQGDSEGDKWLLIGLTSVVTFILLRWLCHETKPILQIGLALVCGGAIGNIWDRLEYGAVADFIHLHLSGYSFYVFNGADSAISIGVIFLLWDALLSPQKNSK